ncbi:MAG: ribbon-helix-helix protein, CopG family [Ketobacter sp.]|nr:ribbon-helix-helix protein, CopG family [Ketobacter sp.]
MPAKPPEKPDNSNRKLGGRRGRKPAAAEERKDRVIQARVPEDLETTLKEAAEKRRMSVSHLIRNVLEDTFTLVDHIVADSSALVGQVSRDARRVAASVRGEGDPKKASAEELLESVDAWQDVVVNKACLCVECNKELKRGQRAYRGLSALQAKDMPPVWLCPDCLEQL